MRRSSIPAALALVAAALAAACGDDRKPLDSGGPVPVPRGDSDATGSSGPGTDSAALPGSGAGAGTTPAATGPGPAGTSRARQPLEIALPDAPPLTADAARRVLLDAISAAVSPEATRDALLAIAATTDVATIRRLTDSILAPGSDLGYADSEAAATAIEARLLAGDEEAAAKAVALAQAGAAADNAWDSFATMLAAVRGPKQAEARALLVRLADDPIVYSAALTALVPLREPAAAGRFHDVATDPEEEAAARCAGALGLLALGDPRADGVLEELVRATENDLTSFDVIDGFAISGVPEALPWIRRIADPIVAADENSTVEIASAAAALAEIRGPGKGTPEEIAWLKTMLGRSDGLSDDELNVAIWTLGDDTHADATANVLAKYVGGVAANVFDEEMGVRILDALAARAAAGGRQFTKAVDAAAAVAIPNDPKRPDMPGRAWRLRIAAARAWLAAHPK